MKNAALCEIYAYPIHKHTHTHVLLYGNGRQKGAIIWARSIFDFALQGMWKLKPNPSIEWAGGTMRRVWCQTYDDCKGVMISVNH